jgi:cytochrome b6
LDNRVFERHRKALVKVDHSAGALYWACKIVTGVPDAIPVVGSTLVELLRGGTSVGQGTLTRFYSLHTFVLPLITAVLMLAHFLMIRKQGISGPL